MSLRSAPLLLGLVALLGCGPGHRLASSTATYQRFELSPTAHPESVSGWYRCFEEEDEEYRKLCLARTPGVRVAEGGGLLCVGQSARSAAAADENDSSSSDLCRAFPVYAAAQYEGASTVDDDNAGAAIAQALGHLLVGIIEAAADSDDDDEPRSDRASRREDRKDEHRSARSERRKLEKARPPAEKPSKKKRR